MALDFPYPPTLNQVYTQGGVSYRWNGYAWVQVVSLDNSEFVKKTGDYMSGNLAISAANPAIALDKTASAQQAYITGRVDTGSGVKSRWDLVLSSSAAESGANAGSNFVVNSYNDDGTYKSSPFYIERNTSHATFAGWVYASQNFISTTTAVVLASNGGAGGYVYLRPQNAASATAEWVATPGGVFSGGGPVEASSFNFRPSTVGGFLCKRGISGVNGGNKFTLWWASPSLGAYVDDTSLGNFTFASDYRIKKDVEDLDSTWTQVKALRPIRYTQAEFSPPSHLARDSDEPIAPLFENDDSEQWGFIAHELQETLIESAATATKDAPDAIQAPNPWTIIAALTKTIQEMQARIEALEAVR